MSRPVDKLLADLLDAVGAAEELVGRGRAAYDTDRILRLAGDAVVGRIGDAAAKLRDLVSDDLPEAVPWDDVDRIIVDQVYHRVTTSCCGTPWSVMFPPWDRH